MTTLHSVTVSSGFSGHSLVGDAGRLTDDMLAVTERISALSSLRELKASSVHVGLENAPGRPWNSRDAAERFERSMVLRRC